MHFKPWPAYKNWMKLQEEYQPSNFLWDFLLALTIKMGNLFSPDQEAFKTTRSKLQILLIHCKDLTNR